MTSPAFGPAAAVAYCPQCGTKLDAGSKFCPKCGAPVAATTQPLSPASGRSESIVVSVPPDSENECINERQLFGWNLQNRQEVVGHLREAETPDGLGQAIWRGAVEGATGKKTFEYDHYVKLHFARSMSTPNLDQIKSKESEYFNLPFPRVPSLKWPVLFSAFFAFGVLMTLVGPIPGAADAVYLPMAGLGAWWINSRVKKQRATRQVLEQSANRMREIKAELQSIVS